MKPLACTIVANNYLAYARSFTRSFLDRHPEGEVHVLIVDRPQPGHRYEDEPFQVTFAHELGIPGFAHFAFRYSVLELSTAVKPSFLLYLHRKLGCDRLCYFDPDILVFGDLGELYARLGEVDAVLTPHLTTPLADDKVPSDRDILQSGIYNLGFLGIACNARTLPFLEWWARRLHRECLHAIDRGLFVDQRWMDFAPAFLEGAEILRDPGYNAAYWNLSHRAFAERGGRWQVNGVPLRFFHFSGFDAKRPELISKFQDRFTFDERPDVAPLFRIYAEGLRREGQEEVQGYPYGYGCFDNGARVPDAARKALRLADPEGKRWLDPFATQGPDTFFAWLCRAVDGADALPLPRLSLVLWDDREDVQRLFPDPLQEDRLAFARWFTQQALDPAFLGEVAHLLATQPEQEEKAASLASLVAARAESLTAHEIEWMTADAGYEPRRRPRVPRLALEMHRRRADLGRAFPDPLGADRGRLALWYTTMGRREYQLPESVVLPVLRTLPWRQRVWARLWWEKRRRQQAAAPAANTPAPAARQAVSTPSPVVPQGFNVIGWTAAPTGVGEACRGTLLALEQAGIPAAVWPLDGERDLETDGQGMPYEVSLYHVNADMMETVQARLPRSLTAGRHRVGYWFWELSHFPLTLAEAFQHVDEVWAPSRFCQEAYRGLAPAEVRWVPPCVAPVEAAPVAREELGIDPAAFLFFFAFDVLSVPERKNPAGLMAAFSRVAKQSRRPVHLLLKTHQDEAEPAYMDRLREAAQGLPVTVMTGTLPRQRLNGLTAACDAYVALHRSEGLGLPLIEAMSLGKPVIATGYGGVTDFLDDTTGFVVRHRLKALDRPQGPYPAGAVWAEPDVEHAAALMTALAKDPGMAAPRTAAARQRVRDLYSPEAVGRRFREELARLRQG